MTLVSDLLSVLISRIRAKLVELIKPTKWFQERICITQM